MLLQTGMSYSVESYFADAQQVSAAIADAEEMLPQIGLRASEAADLTLRIARAQMSEGAWRLQIVPNEGSITISASDAEGARCGLYDALEVLGIRWFAPTRPPTLPLLPVTLEATDRTVRPSFGYRGLHICAGSHHYDAQVGRWMSRLGMNRKLTHHEEIDVLGDKLQARGLEPDTAVHSFALWVPDDPHFGQHPEWFSQVGGRRIRHSEGGQLCVSNPQMRAQICDAIEAWVAEHPSVRVVGIAPNDGYGWCECEACRALDTDEDRAAGTINGRTADFVHDICAQMLERCPDVLIGHYAYSSFLDFVSVRDSFPPNLMVGCTLSRCYRHAIDDEDCPVNRPLHERLRKLRERVEHVTVYEYYMHNWGDLPAPMWRVVANDMRAYHRLGVAGFLTEAGGINSPAWESFHLPVYVAARCMLDVETDLQALLDDYCARRFGPAAVPMGQYLETLRRAVGGMEGCLRHRPCELDLILTKDTRRRGEELLAQAGALTGEGAYASEVEHERSHFNRWSSMVHSRQQYAAPGTVTPLPLDALTIDASPDEERRLVLLDRISLLPPECNRSWVTPYADEERVGLLIDCSEERMDEVVIHREHSTGATCSSDNVEIFLAPARDSAIVYHFIINPEGYRCASECEGTRWNWSWPSDHTVETELRADGWRVLFTIARSDIGATDAFCFSVARNRHRKVWGITGIPEGGAFFRVESYLQVTLASPATR